MFRQVAFLISSVLVLGLAGSASAELVAYWNLDEGVGTVAADASGNGNDGTLEDNPTVVQGQYGLALEFESSRVVISPSETPMIDTVGATFEGSACRGSVVQRVRARRKVGTTKQEPIMIDLKVS